MPWLSRERQRTPRNELGKVVGLLSLGVCGVRAVPPRRCVFVKDRRRAGGPAGPLGMEAPAAPAAPASPAAGIESPCRRVPTRLLVSEAQ